MAISLDVPWARQRLKDGTPNVEVRGYEQISWPGDRETGTHTGVPGTLDDDETEPEPPTDHEGLEELTRRKGTEVLAWYQPFHYYTDDWWGIYILDEGIDVVTEVLSQAAPQDLEPGVAQDQARAFLFRHEFFHHIVETASALAELTVLSAPREKIQEDLSVWANLECWSFYDCGRSSRYRTRNGLRPSLLEEALANAFAFQGVDEDLQDGLADWLATHPPGYRDFGDYLGAEFAEGCDDLWNLIAPGHDLPSDRTGGGPPSIRTVLGDLEFRDVPVRILGLPDEGSDALSLLTSIPPERVRRSQRFKEQIEELDGSLRPQIQSRVELLIEQMQYRGERVFLGHKGDTYHARAGDYRLVVKRNQEEDIWTFTGLDHRKRIYDRQ